MAKGNAMVSLRAPDFELPCTRLPPSTSDRVCLADYQDRWLTLLFYPRDFSLVCPTELTAMSSRIEEFRNRDCDVLGISTDDVETHERWITTPLNQGGLGGLNFPLASDPDGSIAKLYGVYLPRQHASLRGLFIIDPNGVLQYQVVHNLSVGRRAEEVLRVLDGLQTGGLCPENWSRSEPTLDPARTLGPNSIIGQYRIETQIGTGSFASVFRARDLTLERPVALKIIRPGAGPQREAVLREARAAAALNHPNVCTLFAVDGSDGLSVIVMEYLDGEALSKLLERGRLASDRAAAIGRQIASGLAAAHAHGIVHGDLKPANVMVTVDGTAKITDFGLARKIARDDSAVATPEWTAGSSSGIFGTPSYMSPEQARGEAVSTASDVFAFGLILYEMLTGQRAIAGDNILTALRKVEQVDGERLAAEVEAPFADVVRHALIRDPRERNLSMAEIAERLHG